MGAACWTGQFRRGGVAARFPAAVGAATLLALVVGIASATDYPPQDHDGVNWTLMDGDRVWRTHTGVATFEIPAGATVLVRPYDPVTTTTAETGTFRVEADTVRIAGTLDARGAGFTGSGGGGGGGGPCPWPYDYVHGEDGADGVGRYPEFSAGHAGDGPAGGGVGLDGGYNVPGCNTDTSTDESVAMGSGGGGGTGGAGELWPEYYYMRGGDGGGGGGGGGCGGGAVAILATISLEVSGMVMTAGNAGSNGKDGSQGFNYPPTNRPIPGDGGDGGSALPPGEGLGGLAGYSTTSPSQPGQNGGAGSGGGILLRCDALGAIAITGTIDARGGREQLSNGGTVKLFYRGTAPILSAYLGGRFLYSNLDGGPTPTPSPTPTPTPLPPPESRTQFDFLQTPQGWGFVESGVFDAPEAGNVGGPPPGLSLIAVNNSHCFGYWESPSLSFGSLPA